MLDWLSGGWFNDREPEAQQFAASALHEMARIDGESAAIIQEIANASSVRKRRAADMGSAIHKRCSLQAMMQGPGAD